ncbi:general transcription factor IIH subunit 3 [Hordeum vulgare]|uniref:General transcription and DNA repair factor IIH subunit TFB4 n=1 Tax=Hordeum vulgare subsp. vulgare TaxID=112509 RepID=A0A287TE89_HORVV|nr:general transcription and DNA repair factor IIH subunit TFB4 [Hordeum vulgare subsp. vulgare]KAE8766962.1 general transcription factor IIH subunit 3 [Hordeum vulgare]
MTSAHSKLYSDDVSLVVVVVDTNPFFWAGAALPFADFLSHLIHFVNSLLLLSNLNHVVIIAAGVSSCAYVFDSGNAGASGTADVAETLGKASRKLEELIKQDARETVGNGTVADGGAASLFSGALSLALCYIQRIFRSGSRHPQPRILCLQGSPDGPEQYVAVMNSIFSAQRSMVPIDTCIVGTQDSAFLQQASYITGGVYMKPQELSGLFQYLAAVFATDLHSRTFLRLPKTLGVDFRASCFCHKKTIDMGYVCSVCLSIFCKYHKKCSTCGSEFSRVSMPDLNSLPDQRQ